MKIVDIILIALIAAVLVPAIVRTIRSFTKKGGCCGCSCAENGNCHCKNALHKK